MSLWGPLLGQDPKLTESEGPRHESSAGVAVDRRFRPRRTARALERPSSAGDLAPHRRLSPRPRRRLVGQSRCLAWSPLSSGVFSPGGAPGANPIGPEGGAAAQLERPFRQSDLRSEPALAGPSAAGFSPPGAARLTVAWRTVYELAARTLLPHSATN